MPRLPAKVGNIDGGNRVVRPDDQRFSGRHAPQRRLHADYREGAAIAGDVEARGVGQETLLKAK